MSAFRRSWRPMVRTSWLPIVLAALLLVGSVSWAEEADPPVVGPEEIPNEIVVGFHAAIPAAVDDWVEAWGGTVLTHNDVLGWVSVRLSDADAAEEALADALDRPEVRYAQRDGVVTAQFLPPRDPVDPSYGDQWGYPAISAPEAWAWQRGSLAAKVSILDTGIEITHEDLALHACGPFESFVPTEPDILDGHGHGTHVSGTVAAVSDNAVGVAGTSQSCLMGAKVLARSGGGQWTWVADGITWSVDNGAHVISMSLGGGGGHPVVQDAVRYAEDNDVLVVAAAGNSGCWLSDSVLFPAKYEEVMAVASLAAPGNVLSGFSSCGPAVEIAAPGSNVLSTWRGNSYNSISGTSMATPHVSGVAALVKSQWPDVGGAQLRCVLAATVDDLGSAGRDPYFGHGRVHAYEAVTLGGEPEVGLPILTNTDVAKACGVDVPFPWA